jgi:hypothetical protein
MTSVNQVTPAHGRRRTWLRRAAVEDRGSLPMALLVTLIGVSFGALLLPMLITQDRSTRFEVTRVHSLHAAQAGLDVALGLIRSATTVNPATPNAQGDSTKLPCGPLAGQANALGTGVGSGTYRVTVSYYATGNPAAHSGDAAWLASNAMVCVKGSGPYDAASNSGVPGFALLTSSGTDGPVGNGSSQGRTLQTTYVFSATNSNLRGGIIPFAVHGDDPVLCLDAGLTPSNGTQVRVQTCPVDATQPVPLGQSWFYNTDLSIQLVQSVGTPLHPNGLCLTSTATIGISRLGTAVTVTDCATSGNAPWYQQWRSDYFSHLREGEMPDGSPSYACITPMGHTSSGAPILPTIVAPQAGDVVQLQGCSSVGVEPLWHDYQVVNPTADVGTGAAGFATNQLAVSGNFSRCLHLPNGLAFGVLPFAPGGNNFLDLYPCEQALGWTSQWNQEFRPKTPLAATPTTGQWATNVFDSGFHIGDYYLTSPGVVGQYATITWSGFVDLFHTVDPRWTQWTYTGAQDANGKDLPYRDRFTLKDINGYCLGPGPIVSHYQTVIVSDCNGSIEQKWNADPNVQKAKVQNTIEVTFQPPPGP